MITLKELCLCQNKIEFLPKELFPAIKINKIRCFYNN